MPSFNSSGNLAVAVALLFAGALYFYFSSITVSDPMSDLLHNVETVSYFIIESEFESKYRKILNVLC
jgi:hypothetical protein